MRKVSFSALEGKRLCIAGLVLTLPIAGCYQMPMLTSIVPTDEPLANYTLGEKRTAAPGAVMVERIDGTLLLPGFVLTRAIPVVGIGQQPPSERQLWPAYYSYSGECRGGTYLLTMPAFYGSAIGIVVAEDGTLPCLKPVVQIIGSKKGRTWAVSLPAGARPFTPKPYVAGTTGAGLRWQLLYAGRSGNEILLDYREFSDPLDGALARPAFYQQIKYDLGTSRTLHFRETQIEVLDASNAGITFRVLKDERKARRMTELWDGAP